MASELFNELGHDSIDPDEFQAKASKFGEQYKEAGFVEDITPYIHGKDLLRNRLALQGTKFGQEYKMAGFLEDITPYVHARRE